MCYRPNELYVKQKKPVEEEWPASVNGWRDVMSLQKDTAGSCRSEVLLIHIRPNCGVYPESCRGARQLKPTPLTCHCPGSQFEGMTSYNGSTAETLKAVSCLRRATRIPPEAHLHRNQHSGPGPKYGSLHGQEAERM